MSMKVSVVSQESILESTLSIYFINFVWPTYYGGQINTSNYLIYR